MGDINLALKKPVLKKKTCAQLIPVGKNGNQTQRLDQYDMDKPRKSEIKLLLSTFVIIHQFLDVYLCAFVKKD